MSCVFVSAIRVDFGASFMMLIWFATYPCPNTITESVSYFPTPNIGLISNEAHNILYLPHFKHYPAM